MWASAGRGMRKEGFRQNVAHVHARFAPRGSGRVRCRSLPGSGVATAKRLLYDGIVFDMDGTLTQAHIDFVDMRARTGIPVGDLFVSMESWEEEPERIKAAMDVILEIEAGAAEHVSAKEGLQELLDFLESVDVRVSLVTRNTTASVDAFFRLVGDHRRALFDPVLTREFKYVKPDQRLLEHVAAQWGSEPGRMLMVGDSFEDVEVGNAVGAATCLIAGGGNEKPGSATGPPPGAVPTLSVSGLTELRQLLEATLGIDGNAPPEGSPLALGWQAAPGVAPATASAPGAPAAGLGFVEQLLRWGALCAASSSFPIMGAAAGGLAACPIGGHKVLHVCCGDGALTKMIGSKGVRVVGVGTDVEAAQRRGLRASPFAGQGSPLAQGSLASVVQPRTPFDVALVYAAPDTAAAELGLTVARALEREALQELESVLSSSGRLCLEAPCGGLDEGGARAVLEAAGWRLAIWQAGRECVQLVAERMPQNGL